MSIFDLGFAESNVTLKIMKAIYSESHPAIARQQPVVGDLTVHMIKINEIEICRIDHRVIDDDGKEFRELKKSIKEKYLLQPITVRQLAKENAYEIAIGRRRLRAFYELGYEEIPAFVQNTSDRELFERAGSENIHRKSTPKWESVKTTMRHLTLHTMMHEKEVIIMMHKIVHRDRNQPVQMNAIDDKHGAAIVAAIYYGTGVTPATFVRKYLPLIDMPLDVLKVLMNSMISLNVARELRRIKDDRKRLKLMNLALDLNAPWSASKIKAAVHEIINSKADTKKQHRRELTSLNTLRLGNLSQEKADRASALIAELRNIFTDQIPESETLRSSAE
jgi:ParB-like nuclease domain